jgi:hypothetical protein
MDQSSLKSENAVASELTTDAGVRSLADILSSEGCAVAVIGAEVTYEELEQILPRHKKAS